MKGYWIIIGTEVSDQEAQSEYGRLWQPIAQKISGQNQPIEGFASIEGGTGCAPGDDRRVPLLSAC
ncbi:hypothetical protein RPHASCH2410_CH11210 [Rhizobium phaseoli Ch24-10]|nr:hypothetical protein RPHASCH2410_CH11210 [Rhizobium phaseoli Ch24-10]